MGREIKRVPVDFDWPLNKVWRGFLNPHNVSVQCPDCKIGYSREGQLYQDQWYGNAPFDPKSTGSTPFSPDNEFIVKDVRRKISYPGSKEFYMRGMKSEDEAVRCECERMCEIYNSSWSHHLSQDDVDALVKADRLHRMPTANPTAAEVNLHYLFGMGHDSINCWVCVKARCERDGVPSTCQTCNGESHLWPSQEAREIYDAWEQEEPPTGDAYQIWETVSEGSPISPPYTDPSILAAWMVATDDSVTKGTTFEQWVRFITGEKSAPSLMGSGSRLVSGVEAVTGGL